MDWCHQFSIYQTAVLTWQQYLYQLYWNLIREHPWFALSNCFTSRFRNSMIMTRTWLEALRAPSSVSVDSKLGAEISGKTYAELPVFEVSKPPDVETIIVVLYQHCCFSSFIFSTVQDLTRFLVFNFEDSMNRDIFCKIKTYFIPGPVWTQGLEFRKESEGCYTAARHIDMEIVSIWRPA